MSFAGQFTTRGRAREFTLAGNAYITLKSTISGVRFTYRIAAKKEEHQGRWIVKKGIHFVSVLTGSDNENSYTFLGTIFDEKRFERSWRSKIGIDAGSCKAFTWFWKQIFEGEGDLPPGLEVWHEGKCGRCGRKLTVPESVERGLGPECAVKTFWSSVEQLELPT